jgi:hypothetical protein
MSLRRLSVTDPCLTKNLRSAQKPRNDPMVSRIPWLLANRKALYRLFTRNGFEVAHDCFESSDNRGNFLNQEMPEFSSWSNDIRCSRR